MTLYFPPSTSGTITALDNVPVGATTPSTGAFTTLSASSTVSGTGFTSRLATPGPIGNTTASTGAFTTLGASGAVTFTNTTNVGNNTTANNLQLNGPAASGRLVRFQTAGVSRWAINTNSTAEGGSNAGSDLDLITYDDAGSALVNPAVRITRSSGAAQFFGNLTSSSTFSHFGANAGTSLTVWLNAATATSRVHAFMTAGSTRWNVGANNTAEGGSNAGSDYIINAYNDAGSFLSTPLQITRSTGAISLTGQLTMSNTLQVGTSGAAQSLIMNGAAASSRTIGFRTANVERWRLQANATAEGGSNAGSDLDLISYDDAGTALLNPALRISRSSGAVNIFGNTTIQNALTVGTNTSAFTMLTNGPAGAQRPIEWRTANSVRWRLCANSTAEGGSNAGSDLSLISYTDAGSALFNPALTVTRSTGAFNFFTSAAVTPTIATSAGTGQLLSAGDAVAANGDNLAYSYIVGSSSGAISSLGLNHYFSTGGTSTRPNTSKNGWWLQHDVRNAANDGALVLRVISSAGSAATAVTFQTDGSMVQTNGGISTTTLATSGLYSPSSTVGIKGTITNDAAQAGSIGEVISATLVSGSAVSLTTGTCANVTSISLTAGDWDVYGTVGLTLGGTTAVSSFQSGISNTSATMPGFSNINGATQLITGSMAAGFPLALSTGACQQSLSGTTTIYLLATVGFTVSTAAAYGVIWARRRR